MEQPVDIAEGLSGGADHMPLVFFFGHTTPGENPTLFKVGRRKGEGATDSLRQVGQLG